MSFIPKDSAVVDFHNTLTVVVQQPWIEIYNVFSAIKVTYMIRKQGHEVHQRQKQKTNVPFFMIQCEILITIEKKNNNFLTAVSHISVNLDHETYLLLD